jgi:hypothetical protein
LGETSAPSDSTTKAIRLAWANDGYLTIARRRYWWWQEATSTANSNTGATSYAEPTDLKEFIELKIGSTYYDQVPYRANRNYQGAGALVTLPSLRSSFKFYRFGGSYFLIPVDDGDATAHTIKYYKRVSAVADGGTFLIPDDFAPAIEAYAEARYWMSITQQAKAAAPFAEFEEIVKEMERENSRRGTGWSGGFSVRDPEDGFPE